MAFLTPSILRKRISLLELYTDTNHRQLSIQCIRHHAPLESANESYLLCCVNRIRASHFRTLQTCGVLQRTSLRDLNTDTNQPQLLDPCTTHHGPLEYAVGSHLECSACRIRDSDCCAPNTDVVLSHSGTQLVSHARLNYRTLSCRFYPTLRLL